MTSDEALIEKMAEAINEARLHQLATSTELARAALSVVRENDKMVQAGSTGAVRSTDQSTGKRVVEQFYDIVQNDDVVVYSDGSRISVNRGTGRATLALPREGAAQAEPAVAIVDVGQEFFSIVDCEVIIHEPNVDRTSPPSSREPDLPSSLLTRLDVPGGLTKGKRD